jgi:hypothetical protein
VRPEGGRPAGARAPGAIAGPGPLVARADLLEAPRPRTEAPRPRTEAPRPRTTVRRGPGRVRRFVHQYGWRAYAVPLLTIATLAVLIDLAVPVLGPSSATAGAGPTAGAPSPAPPSADGAGAATAQGDAEPSVASHSVGAESYVEKGAGTLSLVDGRSPVYGTGPLRRFVVEVEDGIGVDGASFAKAVETTLADPRSWGNGGRMSFQRVGAAEEAHTQYDFKVSLVSPGSMETYCPGVGTGGYTSCRYGERAVINLARWATAVPDYQGDVATYRQYVINHEVGHALGNGHQNCPGPGQTAPVMQQQTLGLHGCVKNAWPYP